MKGPEISDANPKKRARLRGINISEKGIITFKLSSNVNE